MADDPTPDPDPQPDPPPKPKGKGKAEPAPEPKKIELTQEELDAKIESAALAERTKSQKQRDKEKQDAADALAAEQGKFKELADKEKARADSAAAELRKRDLRDAVRDFLRETHKEYDGCEKYILPQVAVEDDASPEEIAKQVKAACEQYVKDNPRNRTGGAAPPPASGQRKASTPQKDENGQDKPIRITGMAARF